MSHSSKMTVLSFLLLSLSRAVTSQPLRGFDVIWGRSADGTTINANPLSEDGIPSATDTSPNNGITDGPLHSRSIFLDNCAALAAPEKHETRLLGTPCPDAKRSYIPEIDEPTDSKKSVRRTSKEIVAANNATSNPLRIVGRDLPDCSDVSVAQRLASFTVGTLCKNSKRSSSPEIDEPKDSKKSLRRTLKETFEKKLVTSNPLKYIGRRSVSGDSEADQRSEVDRDWEKRDLEDMMEFDDPTDRRYWPRKAAARDDDNSNPSTSTAANHNMRRTVINRMVLKAIKQLESAADQ